MIKDKDIICVALPNWEGDYMKTIVEIMTVLARHNHVLYVDYEYTYKDLVMGFLKNKNIPIKRIIGLEDRLRKLILKNNQEINILTPPAVLPVNWVKSNQTYKTLQSVNAQALKWAIKNAAKRLNFNNPLVINAFNPFFGLPLLHQLDEALTAYYCYDEIAAANWCKAHGATLEQEYMQKVDTVITSSEGLFESKKNWNKNTYLVKNGVNFDLFHQAYHLPKKNKTQKIIGYIGSLDDRLDYALLDHCIQKTPEYKYVFLGRINHEVGKQRLSKHANVELLGPRPPQELPEHLKEFSLGIIPFLKNEFTKGIYPLKINEYLAAGIPVVSTNFASMKDFEKMIALVDTPDEFVQALHQEFQQDSPAKIEQRIEIARSNAWESRAEQLSDILSKHLKSFSSKN